MKLGVTLEEQVILERLIETTKPPLPAECQGLDFLLYSTGEILLLCLCKHFPF